MVSLCFSFVDMRHSAVPYESWGKLGEADHLTPDLRISVSSQKSSASEACAFAGVEASREILSVS